MRFLQESLRTRVIDQKQTNKLFLTFRTATPPPPRPTPHTMSYSWMLYVCDAWEFHMLMRDARSSTAEQNKN